MKTFVSLLASLLLAACTTYGGRELSPGSSTLADVLRVKGEPAMRWQAPDGSVQFAYPRGPAGTATFMVRINPDGRLQNIEEVLNDKGFMRIRPAMTEAEVLQILGPPDPYRTAYFKSRDEQVWEWRYCDNWNHTARYAVVFDGTSRRVRGTTSTPEACGQANCWCSR